MFEVWVLCSELGPVFGVESHARGWVPHLRLGQSGPMFKVRGFRWKPCSRVYGVLACGFMGSLTETLNEVWLAQNLQNKRWSVCVMKKAS